MHNSTISIEISYYPLNEDYKPIIDQFLNELNKHYGLKIVTNTMSTQVFGPFEETFHAVKEAIGKSINDEVKSVFSLKVINSNLDPDTDPHGWNK